MSTIFHAQPVDAQTLAAPIETDITRAARYSVDNASRIVEADEFEESDFVVKKSEQKKAKSEHTKRQKQRKAERQRKNKAKRRK